MNLLQVQTAVMDTVSTMTNAVPQVSSSLESPAVTTINAFDLAVKGGWIMIVLLVLLLLSIYVFIERVLVLKKTGKEDQSFMNRIKDYIYDGKIDTSKLLCQNTDTAYSRMVEKGISRLGRPTVDMMSAIENAGNIEISRMEKGLAVLATTASGAPMLGFLGTVTGMVKAFMDMSSASTVTMDILSTGIYEALITTVGGLIVGILALFGYNYLTTRIKGIVTSMETKIMEFMDILNEPIK
ncbi:MAG: MotA/TolQ/ExbB proton channel family protein [Dysgonamonadaceae bacterium]|jgi:biopolymer transport protein ExbB|nr:MotA/TolQ/ExbB proton channel family protein [Dysgonamonadaceae bacterium]MDD3309952.1 MotA/TolQ/ExbB proton channel family protein [Dysgonamonadaceae bacterium]MDD4399684.1 MotA/TolQ/ExbB proton channel family protein [Dysgonamonadaceae bacterium]